MSAICHVCGAPAVREHAPYRKLRRVTSDCQPWPAGGALGYCDACGTTQKVIGPGWQAEVKRIYEEYAIYHQGAGAEQSVFDQASGVAQARSDRLVARSRFRSTAGHWISAAATARSCAPSQRRGRNGR
jgi:hypothetical protein